MPGRAAWLLVGAWSSTYPKKRIQQVQVPWIQNCYLGASCKFLDDLIRVHPRFLRYSASWRFNHQKIRQHCHVNSYDLSWSIYISATLVCKCVIYEYIKYAFTILQIQCNSYVYIYICFNAATWMDHLLLHIKCLFAVKSSTCTGHRPWSRAAKAIEQLPTQRWRYLSSMISQGLIRIK